MFDEITMSKEALAAIIFLAMIFGAKYLIVLLGAILSVILSLVRFLWLIIIVCVISYAIYHIFSGISFP